ncbi:MAG: F0F1 ATP synthase subunit A [Candidatus Marinimicrobia bacterium]|nr:F0F1 ATP synthase subunit A [Candidatus Neomarinimicrobiota bacterium]
MEKSGSFILEYLKDTKYYELFGHKIQLPQLPPINILGISIDLSITRNVVLLFISSLIIFLSFYFSFRKEKLIPNRFALLLEYIIIFIRDNIVYPTLGRKLGDKYFPFIATLFLFIIISNLMGLVPFMASPTSNLSVTAGLSLVVFFVILYEGIKTHGLFGYFKSLIPGGIPFWLIPVMLPMEIIGLLIRVTVLAIRLFANMLSGHINIIILFFLVILTKSLLISPLALGIAIFVSLIELLVAFIQAYIFSILSVMFISMSIKSH